MPRINNIVNAAPFVREWGTEDLSTRPLPISPEPIPQHLPVWYIQARKGPVRHELMQTADLNAVYHRDTFEPLGKWANHQTIGLNMTTGEGNSSMVHRVSDGTYSKVLLCLDVLRTQVPIFRRDVDGSYKLDNDLEPIPTGETTDGVLCKWVAIADGNNMTHADRENGAQFLGNANIMEGTQTDGVNESLLYPIMEIPAADPGRTGNNLGVRIVPPGRYEDIDEETMEENAAFPYKISIIERESDVSSPILLKNLFGSTGSTFSFNPQCRDILNGQSYYLPNVIEDKYSNLTDGRYEKKFPTLERPFMYEEHIDTVHKLFKNLEDEYLLLEGGGVWTAEDLRISNSKKYLFNIANGLDENYNPYHTFMMDENATTDSIRLSQFTNIYCKGGEDRLMDNETYEDAVRADMERYADKDDNYMDLAVFVESIFWDTGFTVNTKVHLTDFISQRFDTFLVLVTHVDNPIDWEEALTEEEELSTAIALRTRLLLHPESDYFGTPVMRSMIVGGSGRIRTSQWRNRSTLAFDILAKSARYMGAGHGRWKNGFAFSYAPGSIIQNMYDVNIPWVPASRRVRNWDAGLNLPLHYDRRNMFWPALKTIYPNDTSVLNSFITAMAICQLNKIAHACWREYSGVDDMTDDELSDASNQFVLDAVLGRFDGRYVIKPLAYTTENDRLRGFSWTLPIQIYANNMKTVMTTHVQSLRIADTEYENSGFRNT